MDAVDISHFHVRSLLEFHISSSSDVLVERSLPSSKTSPVESTLQLLSSLLSRYSLEL